MWRYIAGAGAAFLIAVAGIFLFRGSAATQFIIPSPPAAAEEVLVEDLPEVAPSAARSREQKRFDRYDKDRDELITRDEYLLSRRKAFAKLDTNGDGRLSFDEWAVKTTQKFSTADSDNSGALTRAEFRTTAPKPKKPSTGKAKCDCPQAPPATDSAED